MIVLGLDRKTHLRKAALTGRVQIACRPVFSIILQPPWHCGQIIVIGDAAHTTTPHLASGASIAIEDSILLARLLQSERSLNAVLDDFMHQRYERCRMIVQNSELLGEWEKKPGMPNEDAVGVMTASYQALVSESGQSRRFGDVCDMSALPPTTAVLMQCRERQKVPTAVIRSPRRRVQ